MAARGVGGQTQRARRHRGDCQGPEVSPSAFITAAMTVSGPAASLHPVGVTVSPPEAGQTGWPWAGGARPAAPPALPGAAAAAVWLLARRWTACRSEAVGAGSGTGATGSGLPASAIAAWAVTHPGVWSVARA